MRMPSIIDGCSRTLGLAAAIIPATAPSAAASPQPSDSIQLTLIPTSRAASGRTAAARIARPSFVNWNRRWRTKTAAIEIAIVEMSCRENATPPTR